MYVGFRRRVLAVSSFANSLQYFEIERAPGRLVAARRFHRETTGAIRMMQEAEELRQIGERMKGLREACDVTAEEMAEDLEVDVERYKRWEATGAGVPISAVYHMARKFGVEFTEILTGTAAKLDTYQVVRAGEGKEVDRYPGYHYDDLAWRMRDKIMQPLEVVLDPSDEPAKLVTHGGQEFNLVLEGTVIVTIEDEEFALNKGDSIYFNPQLKHGQRCGSVVPARFVTVIAE